MHRLDRSSLEALGISRDDILEEIGAVALPIPDVAHGASPAAHVAAAALFAAPYMFAPLSLPGANREDIRLYCSNEDTRVLAVEAPNLDVCSLGNVLGHGEGTWIIDCRAGSAAVVVTAGTARTLFEFTPTEVHVSSIGRAVAQHEESAPRDGLARWTPAPAPSVAALSLAEQLDGLEAQPWLASLAGTMAGSASLLAKVAAAGLVSRLWLPPRSDRDKATAALAAGRGPHEVARRWLSGLPAAVQADVEQMAVAAADAAMERLPDIRALAASNKEAAADAVRRWLHDRDDLESIAVLLGERRASSSLGEALCALDREASVYHSMFSEFSFSLDQRLSEVAWQEPDAWWGKLAG